MTRGVFGRGASIRRGALIACVVLSALAVAPAATGVKPTRDVFSGFEDYVSDECGFPVRIESTGLVIVTTFTDSEGNLVKQSVVLPGGKQVLTNRDTGESITIVITGPAIFHTNPDGSGFFRAVGPWNWTLGHPVTGEPGMFRTTGQVLLAFDAEGNTTSIDLKGSVVDLCDRLAA